jgi:hypothetical protein
MSYTVASWMLDQVEHDSLLILTPKNMHFIRLFRQALLVGCRVFVWAFRLSSGEISFRPG